MSGINIEDDLFYDLFGEDGFLNSESDSTRSPDQDSGHGSPFESTFDASPQSFGWETTGHVRDFWGSILDDLPSDITDDSDSNEQQQPKLQNENYYEYPLNNSDDSPIQSNNEDDDETLSWSTKVLEESPLEWSSNNTMNIDDNNLDLSENSFNNMETAPMNINYVPTHNNNNEFLPSTMPIKYTETSPINVLIGQNEHQESTQIVVKPVTERKCPMWVVKASDIKPQFQIGQNIVAIIQNVGTNNTDEKDVIDTDSICNELAKKITQSIPTVNQEIMITHVKHKDHDYTDKEVTSMTETMGVSKGMGPGLVLTDEEKKLLEMESLKLPEDVPLTKDEEKVLKKVRRKIKNKQSAMESRRKRKEYIENLERRVKHCTDLNQGLRKKVEKLTKENKSLVNQLKTMKEFIAASFQQRPANSGTCLAVLLLSFALFILPFNPLYYEGKSSDNTLPIESANPIPMFRSRTLLAIDDNADYIYNDNELNIKSYPILSDSTLNDSTIHSESVKLHFERSDEENSYFFKTNISVYMSENITFSA